MKIWIFVATFSGSGIVFDTIGDDYVPLSAQAFSAASLFLLIAILFGLKDSFRAWRMHWHWTDSANDRHTSV